MKNILQTMAVSAVLALAIACASVDDNARKLSLGMTKQEVTRKLGSDFRAVGQRYDENKELLEAICYESDKSGDNYLYFRGNKLVQWGNTDVLKNMPAGK